MLENEVGNQNPNLYGEVTPETAAQNTEKAVAEGFGSEAEGAWGNNEEAMVPPKPAEVSLDAAQKAELEGLTTPVYPNVGEAPTTGEVAPNLIETVSSPYVAEPAPEELPKQPEPLVGINAAGEEGTMVPDVPQVNMSESSDGAFWGPDSEKKDGSSDLAA
jgi:hypothetical protein